MSTNENATGPHAIPRISPRERSEAKFQIREGIWTVRCHAKCRLRFNESAVGGDPIRAVELYATRLHLSVDTVELKTGKKDQPPRKVVSVRGKLTDGTEFNVPAVITNPKGERTTIDA